jgi:hypothetical protein
MCLPSGFGPSSGAVPADLFAAATIRSASRNASAAASSAAFKAASAAVGSPDRVPSSLRTESRPELAPLDDESLAPSLLLSTDVLSIDFGPEGAVREGFEELVGFEEEGVEVEAPSPHSALRLAISSAEGGGGPDQLGLCLGAETVEPLPPFLRPSPDISVG